MKIILDNHTSECEIEIEITRSLHDLHLKINEAHDLADSKYQYHFGERIYSFKGFLNTISHQCDLFIYEKNPVVYCCRNLILEIYHKNISDNIYDYCDFDHSHYCSVFEQTIDIDLCYDSMMILNGFFRVESSRDLMMIQDIDLAREKCRNCIYSNCDAIDNEQKQKGISLEEFVHRSEGVNLSDQIVYIKPKPH